MNEHGVFGACLVGCPQNSSWCQSKRNTKYWLTMQDIYFYIVFIFYSSIALHTQKVITENVMAKLKKRGKQLSVPLETKMAPT